MTKLRQRLATWTTDQLEDLAERLNVSSTGEISSAERSESRGARSTRLVAYFTQDKPTDGREDIGDSELLDTASLKEHARRSLPAYMCPSVYVEIKDFPRLPNGKYDYNRLPEPEIVRAQEAHPTPAENQNLDKLISILSVLLGADDIRPTDNFFEIGGDSITAIQFVAKARDSGIPLNVPSITSALTLESLAESLPSNTSQPTLLRPFGTAPLTPIQSWFFSQQHPVPEHWNCGGLLHFTSEIESTALQNAIRKGIEAHPGLGARFYQTDGQWQSEFMENPPPDNLIRTLTTADDDSVENLIEACQQVQHEFVLSEGWLIRFVIPVNRNNRVTHLFWVAHHLVIDTLSEQILLDTILKHCVQQDSPTPSQDVTLSMREWALKIQHQAQELDGGALRNTQSDDRSPLSAKATENDCVSLITEFDEALTNRLLGANRAYGTQTQELILTALALAWYDLTQSAALTVDVETHGRDLLGEEIDTSGTVGWFTSFLPVSLTTSRHPAPGDQIKSVKESFRQSIRENRYHLLRSMYSQSNMLASTPNLTVSSPVLFNFFGNTGSDTRSGNHDLWQPCAINELIFRAGTNKRSHPIELNVDIHSLKLRLHWRHPKGLRDPVDMTKLSTELKVALTKLIEHCDGAGKLGYSPSDFPEIDFDQSELDDFLTQLNKS